MKERGLRDFDGITIDCTAWPVIVWQSPPERVSDRATADALGWLEELWRSTPAGSKSFTLTDLSTMREAAPASQRKYAADFMHRNRELQVRASVGGAIVATSALVRGVLTAVFWLERSTLPMRLVATREEGLVYGIDLLSSACPPVPAHLQELRATLGGGSGDAGQKDVPG
ncbi:MAG TPA: hypothetical protein VKU41_28115 [Polyangiaceae bacterium]|nr:hypothetical protein [Polyangiaceae bacterium]